MSLLSPFTKSTDPLRPHMISKENPSTHWTQNIRPLGDVFCLEGLKKGQVSIWRFILSPFPFALDGKGIEGEGGADQRKMMRDPRRLSAGF